MRNSSKNDKGNIFLLNYKNVARILPPNLKNILFFGVPSDFICAVLYLYM